METRQKGTKEAFTARQQRRTAERQRQEGRPGEAEQARRRRAIQGVPKAERRRRERKVRQLTRYIVGDMGDVYLEWRRSQEANRPEPACVVGKGCSGRVRFRTRKKEYRCRAHWKAAAPSLRRLAKRVKRLKTITREVFA